MPTSPRARTRPSRRRFYQRLSTDFAARADAPESVRVEALGDLADWAKPLGRDKIVGLWRPLPPRDPAPARSALSAAWSGLAADPTTNILVAALDAGSRLGVLGLAATLRQLAKHPDAGVRAVVAKLQGAARPATLAELTAQLERGSVQERQAALAALADRPEAGADAVLAAQMDQLLAAKLPPELALDVLEAATVRAARGRPGGLESPPSRERGLSSPQTQLITVLARWTNSLPKGDPLAPYRPALVGGDAARGRAVFTERQDLACLRCHKLKGEGGEVGPDLTGIARAKGREYVLRSVLFPNAEIAAGFESVVVTRQDGSSVTGVLKSETAAELVIDTPEDGRVTVKKAEVASRERGPSAMIEGLSELMSPHELRDLVEALTE